MQQQQQPTDADGSSWHTAQRRAQQLCPAKDPLAAVEQVAAALPAWARSGYPVVDPAAAQAASTPPPSENSVGTAPATRPRRPVGSVPLPPPAPPLPDEAAAVLGVVARRASLAPPPPASAAGPQQRPLARHRTVRGLVRALRLEHMSPAAPPPAAGAAAAGGAVGEHQALSAAGLSLSPAAVGPTLWALAVLGGCEYWEAEAEALCALLPHCRFTSWYQVGGWRSRIPLSVSHCMLHALGTSH